MNSSILSLLVLVGVFSAEAQLPLPSDIIPTASGDLQITFIGHGSLIFGFGGKTIHVDPYGKLTDYAKIPKADIILLTHDHPDHLDPAAIGLIRKRDTSIVLTASCAEIIEGGTILKNGGKLEVKGLEIQAVPAYNLVNMRPDGQPFHPRGVGNGYILNFGGKRVYVAGDTENTPELKALKGIDVAFLPMSLPYTMTPAMVADAAKALRPGILYPYHCGTTHADELGTLMKDTPSVQVRIRPMP